MVVPDCGAVGRSRCPVSITWYVSALCPCSAGLSELQVQQCHTCKAVYCSSCSVINYDEREDRVFCLDCNEDSMQVRPKKGGGGLHQQAYLHTNPGCIVVGCARLLHLALHAACT